jgi:hypothetical protein
LISCSQPSPVGASSTRRVSCGLIHLGGRDVVPTPTNGAQLAGQGTRCNSARCLLVTPSLVTKWSRQPSNYCRGRAVFVIASTLPQRWLLPYRSNSVARAPSRAALPLAARTRIVISGRTSLQNVSRFAQEGRGNTD